LALIIKKSKNQKYKHHKEGIKKEEPIEKLTPEF